MDFPILLKKGQIMMMTTMMMNVYRNNCWKSIDYVQLELKS